MQTDKNEISRNRPADEGKANDPERRDDSGQQPGTSTMSSSNADDINQTLSEKDPDDVIHENSGNPDAGFEDVREEDEQ